jgi:sodium-dependent dicarboxylate transporter 2/3/5
MALLLFLIPSQTEKGRALLTWKEASKLPYEIILLFGSGFALAKGFELSGLGTWLAQQLNAVNDFPLLLTILLICIIVTIISEFASNVASIQLMMPILISLQLVTAIDPKLLLVPAALSASLGFMLPIATAPNTIAFSSGHIKVREMVLVGFFVDVIGILLILLFSNWM